MKVTKKTRFNRPGYWSLSGSSAWSGSWSWSGSGSGSWPWSRI